MIYIFIASPERLYFVNLVIVNTLPYVTSVKTLNNSFDASWKIEPKSELKKKIKLRSTETPRPIILTAVSIGKTEYINGVKFGVKVTPRQDETQTYIYVGYKGKIIFFAIFCLYSS